MKNKTKKINQVFLFFSFEIFIVVLSFFLGCTSAQVNTNTQINTREDSIPVILNVSEELKIEAFQSTIIRYFRRYNPTLQNDNTFSIQYGRFPVKVSFVNDRVFINSSIPDKHSLWLSNIRKGMQNIFILN